MEYFPGTTDTEILTINRFIAICVRVRVCILGVCVIHSVLDGVCVLCGVRCAGWNKKV